MREALRSSCSPCVMMPHKRTCGKQACQGVRDPWDRDADLKSSPTEGDNFARCVRLLQAEVERCSLR